MFRTELPLTPHPHQLPHSARVLTIGSCFSDSIGRRLTDFKVAALVNPFGTVFNPVSACKLLRAAAGEDMDWQQHLVEARGRWQSHDLHAEIGAASPVELLQQIQGIVRETGVFLATADAVVLTLGTAFAYRLRETQEIISNCHKIPAEKFEKELLTADEMIAAVAETHAYLRRINPRLRFILTVSPVRHLKETLPLSSVSKSMLRVACHYLSELLPDVSYFPAYELLLDDLRDYRFYAADMLHPSEVAENYIWERFTRTYFDAGFGRFKKEWEGIRQALQHHPLYAAAPEHRQFLEGTLARLQRLSAQADVRMEMLHVERELATLPLPPSPPAPELEEDDDEERVDIGEVEADEKEAPFEEEEVSFSQATLLRRGAGMLVETDSEEEVEEEPEEVTAEDAYETAYTAGLADSQDDTEDSEEHDTETIAGIEVETADSPIRKKKRRSRGGAKRTKKKHARLAAEAAAVEGEATAVYSAPDTENSPKATPEEAPADIVYVSEAELFGARPVQTAQPAEETSGETLQPAEAASAGPEQPAPDNSQQGSKRRSGRGGRKSGRPALYAAPTEEPVESAIMEPAALIEEVAEVTPEIPAVVVSEATPEVQPSAGTSRRSRGNNRSARLSKAAEIAAVEVAVEAPAAIAAPVPTAEATPAAPEVKPRPKRAPRRPAAAATESASASVEPAAELPTEPTAVPKKPARRTRPTAAAPASEPLAPEPVVAPEKPKRASRSKKVATPPAEAVASTPVAPETEAAPKRKPRPPRRKPAPEADTQPETT